MDAVFQQPSSSYSSILLDTNDLSSSTIPPPFPFSALSPITPFSAFASSSPPPLLLLPSATTATFATTTAFGPTSGLLLEQNELQQQQPPVLDTWRVPASLFAVFVSFYAAVFFCGLVGNLFVVAAIAMNKSLRTATDWLISSLAFADLLILIFCLPSTLLNNLLTEWQLGSFGCKVSVWINSTTSCASIFTLVGVTGDRYLAICHPLRQLKLKNSLLHCYILGIWALSALLASPNLWLYREILFDLETSQELVSVPSDPQLVVARLCVDTSENIWLFIVTNLFIAFLVPIVVICVLYALIFRAVSIHTQKKLAVDNGARLRDERVKLRIAQMMFTVIVVFVLCWTPLYALYCYFFLTEDRHSSFFQFASSVLRPIFQWLSLLSSCLNPLIYIAFSQKYRRAFHYLMLLPCRNRYQKIQRATRSTFRLSSAFSEKVSTFSHITANGHISLSGVRSGVLRRPRASADAALVAMTSPRRVSFCTVPAEPCGHRKLSEQMLTSGTGSGGGGLANGKSSGRPPLSTSAAKCQQNQLQLRLVDSERTRRQIEEAIRRNDRRAAEDSRRKRTKEEEKRKKRAVNGGDDEDQQKEKAGENENSSGGGGGRDNLGKERESTEEEPNATTLFSFI